MKTNKENKHKRWYEKMKKDPIRKTHNDARIRDGQLKRKFHLTRAEYDKLFEKQNGVCAVCGKPETTKKPSGKLQPLSIDHIHETGETIQTGKAAKIRGLLCSRCNAALGMFGDTAVAAIPRIEAAIRYLKRAEKAISRSATPGNL